MQTIIAKGSEVFGVLFAFLGAPIRQITHIPEALVEAIEKHALRK
jgi:hypothetical protein